MPLLGRSKEELIDRVTVLLDAKTAVVVAMHQFSDAFTGFCNWALPDGELTTDVRTMLRRLYLEA